MTDRTAPHRTAAEKAKGLSQQVRDHASAFDFQAADLNDSRHLHILKAIGAVASATTEAQLRKRIGTLWNGVARRKGRLEADRTPLVTAAVRMDVAAMRLMVEGVPDLVEEKLFELCGGRLLRRTASVWHPDVLQHALHQMVCQPATTAAQQAAAGEIIDLLLASGEADLASSAGCKKTALVHAVIFGHAEHVRLLIERHADVDQKLPDGSRAIFWALRAKTRGEECLQLLLDRRASVADATPTGDDRSLLTLATRCAGATALAMLLDSRHWSMTHREEAAVQLFLQPASADAGDACITCVEEGSAADGASDEPTVPRQGEVRRLGGQSSCMCTSAECRRAVGSPAPSSPELATSQAKPSRAEPSRAEPSLAEPPTARSVGMRTPPPLESHVRCLDVLVGTGGLHLEAPLLLLPWAAIWAGHRAVGYDVSKKSFRVSALHIVLLLGLHRFCGRTFERVLAACSQSAAREGWRQRPAWWTAGIEAAVRGDVASDDAQSLLEWSVGRAAGGRVMSSSLPLPSARHDGSSLALVGGSMSALHLLVGGGCDASVLGTVLRGLAQGRRGVGPAGQGAAGQGAAGQAAGQAAAERYERVCAFVCAADENGLTPLHWACMGGDLELVRVLAAFGGPLALCCTDFKYGASALHVAAWLGHCECAKWLLQAQLTHEAAAATTVRDEANRRRRRRFVDPTCAPRADFGGHSALHYALACECEASRVELVAALGGVDRSLLEQTSGWGWSPLQMLTIEDSQAGMPLIRALLDAKADPDTRVANRVANRDLLLTDEQLDKVRTRADKQPTPHSFLSSLAGHPSPQPSAFTPHPHLGPRAAPYPYP